MIEDGVMIHEKDRVFIHPSATIRTGAILRPETGWIVVHSGAVVGSYCVIHGKGGVEIGRNTMLSPHSQIYAQNHTYEHHNQPIKLQPNIGHGVYIMGDCWIGANTVITDDVTIGKGSVVGAGAVVTRSMPMGSIAMGVPARVVDNRFRREDTWHFATRERLNIHAPGKYINHAHQRIQWAREQLDETDRVVLDVGCGDGYFAQLVAHTVPTVPTIYGVDYSLDDLHDFELGSASFMKMNSTHLKFPTDTFDCVFLLDVIEHLMPNQAEKTLNEIHRVLKPGGRLIGTTPVDVEKYETYSHIKEYTLSQLATLLVHTFEKYSINGDKFVCYKRNV